MKKIFTIVFLVFSITSLALSQYPGSAAGQSPDETKTVVATGFGAILSGDMVKAKEDGVNDALRKAVEQVVGTIIDANTVTENFMTLEDNIYSRTTGYVQTYDVIGTNQRPDNSLEVTVRAVVKAGNLKNDLQGILTVLKSEGMPRLMVVVDEENIGQYRGWISTDLNTTETALMNELMSYGFPFVDAATAKSNVAKDALSAAMTGDSQAAANIAKRSGAEILIIGTARTTVTQPPVMQSSGMKSCNANLTLRAVRADDAVVIATSSARGVNAHIDDLTGSTLALEKAAKQAAVELKNKIVEKFQKNQFETRQIQLQILNISNFSQLNTLKNSLPYYVRGLKKVYQRSFESGTALFDIEITQKAETVAAELSNKTIEGLNLEIISVTQNKVTAKILTGDGGVNQSGGLR
ncbi:MAG: hypothetical protein AB7W47_03555 [Calditrichaceae bacterium]